MSTIEEIIAGLAEVRVRSTTVRVCKRADLAEEHAELAADLKATLENGVPRTMTATALVASKAEKIKDLEQRIAAEALVLTVYAMESVDFAALVAEFPPRPDTPADKALGVNLEGFMGEAIPVCLTPPGESLSVEQREQLVAQVNRLASEDQERIVAAVWRVNRGEGDPKSPLASLVIETYGTGSMLLPDSGSPLGSSTGTPRKSSTSISTAKASGSGSRGSGKKPSGTKRPAG